MNKKLKRSIIFTGFSMAMLTAASSFAVCMEGPYISGNLAASWLQSQNYHAQTVSGGPLANGANLHLPSETGWGGGLAVGSQHGPYRLEAALDYLTNRANPATLSNDPIDLGTGVSLPLVTSGKVSATTLLINGYYDFMPQAVWTPYVGVGLGMANLRTSASFFEPVSEISGNIHDNANKFAYQGIVGTSWKVNDRIKANVDYRYLATTKATFDGSANGIAGQAKSRYTNNRVTAGMTYYFD